MAVLGGRQLAAACEGVCDAFSTRHATPATFTNIPTYSRETRRSTLRESMGEGAAS